MKQLNKEQRKFLEYLRDTHHSMGWKITVTKVLNNGKYSSTDLADLNFIIKKFKSAKTDRYIQDRFGKPTKYLK